MLAWFNTKAGQCVGGTALHNDNKLEFAAGLSKLWDGQEWALKQLIDAGETGCTSVTNLGPRWSGYVHRLRRKGLIIETVYEPHGGSWPGMHGRYFLRSYVEPLSANDDEALVRCPSNRRAA